MLDARARVAFWNRHSALKNYEVCVSAPTKSGRLQGHWASRRHTLAVNPCGELECADHGHDAPQDDRVLRRNRIIVLIARQEPGAIAGE